MGIIEFLSNSKVVRNFDISDFRTFSSGYYIKISVTFINDFKLYITEYVDLDERMYSYHLQNKSDELIIRFDNAPYHKDIPTYPHHFHFKDNIMANDKISSEEILNVIIEQINIYL